MKNAISIFLILLGFNSMAQTEDTLNRLFDKKWTIKSYEIGGQNFPATDIENVDCTIFYADHNVKSIDHGITNLSKWKYDTAQNMLVLYSEGIKETTEMKIYILNETEFVWQTNNPEGMIIKIHMFN